MRKLILLVILTFVISQMTFSQEYGWTDISANMPEQGTLSDIHVIGEEVWISGGNDKVFYSPDGGTTILIQNTPPQPGNSGITSSIFMKNNQGGYVVTYSGEIYKTDDGGTTWTTLHEPGGGFTSIHFPPNSDIGFACGWGGKIWRFDDYSITDISVAGLTANLLSIMFPEDSTEGKLCGDSSIRRWLNNTWNNFQVFDNNFVYNAIFFINNNTGWVVGSQGKIFKTVDATIWNGQSSGTTKGLNDLFFIDSLEGWIVGTEVLFHTVDGGENWTQELANQTVGKELVAVYFTDANNGYVVGNGVVFKYGELSGLGEETQAIAFDLFPNPVNDKLQVNCSELNTENGIIEILSLDGKILFEKELRKGNMNTELDVSQLNCGMYFCKLTIDNRSSTKKIIKE